MTGYKVTDTREMDRMTPAGSVVKTYRVWLVTDNGATGHIDIPLDQWNKDDLPGVLEAKAAELDLAFAIAR